MGTDFCMTGRQPDPEMRRKCIRFIVEFGRRKPVNLFPAAPTDYIHCFESLTNPVKDPDSCVEIDAFGDPIYADTPIERDGWNWKEEGCSYLGDAYASCEKPAKWNDRSFEGVILDQEQIIFDNAAGGVLCQMSREGCTSAEGEEVWNWWGYWLRSPKDRTDCERIELHPCVRTRFLTGYPYFFILAWVMKCRFIPDLKVHDSYFDIDYYGDWLKRLKYTPVIAEVSEEKLPDIAIEAANQIALIRTWISETAEGITQRNQRRLRELGK